MMTSTGPLVLSGFAAGVSVEGPIASVSVRFGWAGTTTSAGADGIGSEFVEDSITVVCGVVISVGAIAGVSETCAVDMGVALDA